MLNIFAPILKQMQKKMYLPAPKKTLRVSLRRLNWQLSELWRIISLKVFLNLFPEREGDEISAPSFFSNVLAFKSHIYSVAPFKADHLIECQIRW